MSYQPTFKGPIEGWTVNFCKTNYWRVERSMEWADLMQEAYIVFLRCCTKAVDLAGPSHFMALYKTAWFNQFTNFAHADTKLRHIITEGCLSNDDDGPSFEAAGEIMNDGALATMLRQAPREVLMVLNLFLNAPAEIVETALAGWQGRNLRRKDGGSGHICKLLGLQPGRDIMGEVEEYFRVH